MAIGRRPRDWLAHRIDVVLRVQMREAAQGSALWCVFKFKIVASTWVLRVVKPVQ